MHVYILQCIIKHILQWQQLYIAPYDTRSKNPPPVIVSIRRRTSQNAYMYSFVIINLLQQLNYILYVLKG